MTTLHLLNVRALDEDTGNVGTMHVVCDTKVDAMRLAYDLAGEGIDPADLAYSEVPGDWTCSGHNGDTLCGEAPIEPPRLN